MDEVYVASAEATEKYEYRNQCLVMNLQVHVYEVVKKSRALLEENVNELYAKLPISCEEDLASQLDEMFEKHHSHMLSNIHEKVNASAHVDTGTSVPSRLDFLQSVQGTFGRLVETNRLANMKKKNDDLKREAKRARMANESLILDLERARSLATDCLKDFAEVSGKKLAHRRETFEKETNKVLTTLIQELEGPEQDHANDCQTAGEMPHREAEESGNIHDVEVHEGQPTQESDVLWSRLARAVGGGVCIGKRAMVQEPGSAEPPVSVLAVITESQHHAQEAPQSICIFHDVAGAAGTADTVAGASSAD
eukprot:jgi/Undpi1/10609/HiC_scaffold_29.g13059.m1